MATFTEAEITSICEVLESNSDLVSDILSVHGSLITESDKAAALAKIDQWNAGIGSNFTAIRPMEANFGALIDPSEQRGQLKRQIAKLLYCDQLLNGSGGQVKLIRG